MKTAIDTYVSSQDLALLTEFCDQFVNYIPIRTGIPATKHSENTDDIITQEAAAIGDPLSYYTCVRSKFPIQLPKGITKVDIKLGSQIVGVWS